MGGRPAPEEKTPVMTPVRAFLMLVAVAVVVPVTILATRPEAAPTNPPAQATPDFSLTDAEAIAEFDRLNASLMAAYRERNIALAESVFTSDSPMLPRVRKEIDELIESSVVSRTRFEEISSQVLDQSAGLITLERVEIVRPRFETEAGRDVSGSSRPERERVRWELRLERGEWLLHDATVVGRTEVDV